MNIHAADSAGNTSAYDSSTSMTSLRNELYGSRVFRLHFVSLLLLFLADVVVSILGDMNSQNIPSECHYMEALMLLATTLLRYPLRTRFLRPCRDKNLSNAATSCYSVLFEGNPPKNLNVVIRSVCFYQHVV